MEQYRQTRIMDRLCGHLKGKPAVRALEIGVGIGLFAKACRERGWEYLGVDRNDLFLSQLGAQFEVVKGELPPLPGSVPLESFDVAYSFFVVEHLADGEVAFQFVHELARALRPGGLMVLGVPDALSLGMEFWNLDYTHKYPTADRNVSQVLLENQLHIEKIVRYRGPGFTGLIYWVLRFFGFFFNYRLGYALLGRRDWLYSVYQYVKQDVLLFICRKPEADVAGRSGT
jgi:SAM-dependent methyltransferase